MTTSIMTAYGEWTTTSNATISKASNVFSFSRPLNLILPYLISLLLALPFILIGGIALHKNGVSAIDGGFMQIITTSTGSAVLNRAVSKSILPISHSWTLPSQSPLNLNFPNCRRSQHGRLLDQKFISKALTHYFFSLPEVVSVEKRAFRKSSKTWRSDSEKSSTEKRPAASSGQDLVLKARSLH